MGVLIYLLRGELWSVFRKIFTRSLCGWVVTPNIKVMNYTWPWIVACFTLFSHTLLFYNLNSFLFSTLLYGWFLPDLQYNEEYGFSFCCFGSTVYLQVREWDLFWELALVLQVPELGGSEVRSCHKHEFPTAYFRENFLAASQHRVCWSEQIGSCGNEWRLHWLAFLFTNEVNEPKFDILELNFG